MNGKEHDEFELSWGINFLDAGDVNATCSPGAAATDSNTNSKNVVLGGDDGVAYGTEAIAMRGQADQ
ncbi:MAG: hypothetical protein ACU84Q_01030 [Gammaproteobacteria bacterium]